jgi:hypothetical protein
MKDNLLASFELTKLIDLNQIKGGKNLCSLCKTKNDSKNTTMDTDYDDGSGTTSEDKTVYGETIDFLKFWD